MATFRKLHTTFWTDPFVENLTQNQKLFYLYLISNTKTKQSGIYEISKKYIAYETGFPITEVNELITFFVNENKIFYSEATNEIAIMNWIKYNHSFSKSVLKCIETDLYEVKDKELIKTLYNLEYINTLLSVDEQNRYTPLIEYLQSIHNVNTECLQPMDTGKQQEQEQEEEQAQASSQELAQEEAKRQAEEWEKSFTSQLK